MKDIFLILGGTGMLGRQIAERLKARGDLVSVLDLVQRYDDIPFYPGDIAEEGVVLSVIKQVSELVADGKKFRSPSMISPVRGDVRDSYRVASRNIRSCRNCLESE